MNRKRMITLAGTSALLLMSPPAVAGAAPVRDATTTSSRGFGWIDLAVGVAVLIGIALLGLFGDRVIGAIVVGVAEAPAAGAKVVRRIARAGRRREEAQTSIVTASPRSSSPS